MFYGPISPKQNSNAHDTNKTETIDMSFAPSGHYTKRLSVDDSFDLIAN